ncbi:MAG: SiaC family regulatory phosphoprotein [Nitrososphaeraceae archaeon]|nr:SiaC family regulatory phosphoprotein [Nitrososphaeraceae archaeon]
MSVLEIPAKEAAPYVRFDESNGELEIRGKSYDEDVVMLFSMLRSKIKAFGKKSPEKLDVYIFLKYFNTSSSKCLFDLLSDIKDLEENENFTLNMSWDYVEGDEEMEEEISDFKDSLEMDFSINGVEEEA